MEIVDLLKDKLPKEKLKFVPRSWDIIGDICIVKLDEQVKKYDKLIGKAIMKIHRNVNSVYEKVKPISGTYRTTKHRWICGEQKTETIHREHGCRFKLDIQEVYFSPRLSNERKRVAKKVKENEGVLLMFAGIGVYGIIICKYQPKVKIYAVELNPKAYQYMVKNVKLNRFQEKIIPLKGDVREVVPRLEGKFDRILMPLPKGAEGFLDLAYNKVKPRGVIHYYSFVEEPKLFQKPTEVLKEMANKNNKKIKILEKVKCGQYAPGKWRVCLDVLVE